MHAWTFFVERGFTINPDCDISCVNRYNIEGEPAELLCVFIFRENVLDKFDHLKNLAIMSAADGSLSEQEISLLIDRCTELGLTEEHLEQAIAFALSRTATLALPTELDEQEKVLEDMIRMMAADGQLAESEKRLFAFTAAKMGFPKDRLDALIDRLVKSVKDKD